MSKVNTICTIGVSPCWDIVCRGQNLRWQAHQLIEEQTCRPAGKALNVSRALVWMGIDHVAAGLWGRQDYGQMQRALRDWRGRVEMHFVPVAGQTRRNITLVDTRRRREMHLRSSDGLLQQAALRKLQRRLSAVVQPASLCVFAGSLPTGTGFEDVLSLARQCRDLGARLVWDSSGRALRSVVDRLGGFLCKPNVAELAEWLGREVPDRPRALIGAARGLLDRVEMLLISRGAKGALLLTRRGAWQARCRQTESSVESTVGCGDCLLAGFLAGWVQNGRPDLSLRSAVQAATAHAWGHDRDQSWPQVSRRIKVDLCRIPDGTA
ncbi:MAG: hypothetical protein JW810_05275 [Sedimentisphaerales bacterium]|nr:hypothetical protein [Sedimentisphaerales bacterium]